MASGWCSKTVWIPATEWKEEILCWIKHYGSFCSCLCCKPCVTEEKSLSLSLFLPSNTGPLMAFSFCSCSCCVFSLFLSVRFFAGLMVLTPEDPGSRRVPLLCINHFKLGNFAVIIWVSISEPSSTGNWLLRLVLFAESLILPSKYTGSLSRLISKLYSPSWYHFWFFPSYCFYPMLLRLLCSSCLLNM